MIALIDADSICYIIGWKYKDTDNSKMVELAADELISYILSNTKATHYLGVLSNSKTFRNDVYKYAPYKGTRPDKPEWYLKWEPTIKERMVSKWSFIDLKKLNIRLEADDLVCFFAHRLSEEKKEWVICSPDKDMKQVAGLHFDYKQSSPRVECVDKNQASLNFWMQMLTGDSVDNIKGIPKVGEVKATALLKDSEENRREHIVMEEYVKYFGEYYGQVIFDETKSTVEMYNKNHPIYDKKTGDYIYSFPIVSINGSIEKEDNIEDVDFESLFN